MDDRTRRNMLELLAAAGAGAAIGCSPRGGASAAPEGDAARSEPAAPEETVLDPVVGVTALGAPPWPTLDPFLFCVHHDDAYPAGDGRFGPAASLEGRQIGRDFAGKDGWSMYHGRTVPGFPQHPHRGFETVTVVRHGLLDHSDSMGAAARYGRGDVQWLTAGSGILHAEMFPLLDRAGPNPVELFQIWLNLPRADKFAEPHFTMLWADTIPRRTVRDDAGRSTELTVMAGRLDDAAAPSPPPSSWASRAESHVAIWTIRMDPEAAFTLPATVPGLNRALYVVRGDGVQVGPRAVTGAQRVQVRSDLDVPLRAGPAGVELLMLQGRPIGEPVVKYGPFVMTSREEIEQAFADYRATSFGGWPWDRNDPVHGAEGERFARHADGRIERPA